MYKNISLYNFIILNFINYFINYLLSANLAEIGIILFSMIFGILSMFSVNLSEEFKFVGLICLSFFFLSQIYIAIKSYQKGFKPALFFLIATGVALFMFLTYMLRSKRISANINKILILNI